MFVILGVNVFCLVINVRMKVYMDVDIGYFKCEQSCLVLPHVFS